MNVLKSRFRSTRSQTDEKLFCSNRSHGSLVDRVGRWWRRQDGRAGVDPGRRDSRSATFVILESGRQEVGETPWGGGGGRTARRFEALGMFVLGLWLLVLLQPSLGGRVGRGSACQKSFLFAWWSGTDSENCLLETMKVTNRPRTPKIRGLFENQWPRRMAYPV